MRIGIDAFPIWELTGLGHYTQKLLEYFGTLDKKNEFIIFCNKKSIAHIQFFYPNYEYVCIPFDPQNKLSLLFVEQIIIPLLAVYYRVSALFYPTIFNSFFTPCRKIITLADAGYFLITHPFSKKAYTRIFSKSAERAQDVITLSQFSKDEIASVSTSLAQKSHIVPLATDIQSDAQRDMSVFEAFHIQQPYFLYIGLIMPHKNIENILRAFAILAKKYTSVQLVLAGSVRPQFFDAQKCIAELHLEARAILTGYVSDERKNALFSNAHAFIFPSSHEGFGIPILEAQAMQIPVLTSPVTSIPEVAGDSALYVDPSSFSDIASGMEELFIDEHLRRKYIEKGSANVKRFSWRRTTEGILNILLNKKHT